MHAKVSRLNISTNMRIYLQSHVTWSGDGSGEGWRVARGHYSNVALGWGGGTGAGGCGWREGVEGALTGTSLATAVRSWATGTGWGSGTGTGIWRAIFQTESVYDMLFKHTCFSLHFQQPERNISCIYFWPAPLGTVSGHSITVRRCTVNLHWLSSRNWLCWQWWLRCWKLG